MRWPLPCVTSMAVEKLCMTSSRCRSSVAWVLDSLMGVLMYEGRCGAAVARGAKRVATHAKRIKPRAMGLRRARPALRALRVVEASETRRPDRPTRGILPRITYLIVAPDGAASSGLLA